MDAALALGLLKRATWYEVIFVTVAIMPFPLLAWGEVLDSLGYSQEQKEIGVYTLAVVQCMGIMLIVSSSMVYRRRLKDLTVILAYLHDKNFRMMSFERIREKHGGKYTDEYLRSLIDMFSDRVRYAVLKGGKPGLASLNEPVKEE